MTDLFFIQYAFDPGTRFFYFAWVLVVVISIVLHELAHGWMAIRRGDDTPMHLGRMTGNPLVHMGPFSLAVLAVFGIAWGQMPIDPTRLRGRYSEAMVAAAGPAMNLALGLASLVALGLLIRFDLLDTEVTWQSNLWELLFIAGSANMLLCAFNLMPVPPLDGSHILANLSRRYANFVSDPNNQGIFFLGFAFAFMLAGYIGGFFTAAAVFIVGLISTLGA